MKRGDFRWGDDRCTLTYTTKLKLNDPALNPLVLTFIQYEIEELCVYCHLKEYMGLIELMGGRPSGIQHHERTTRGSIPRDPLDV